MIHAALLASLSAVLGGGIAVLSHRRPSLLERTRTFAFAAAAGVVAFHLLPEVLPSQGLAALLWIAVGFSLPWALEAAARVFGPRVLRGRGLSTMRVTAEVGLVALIFHSVVEGLTLVAALAQPGRKLDLEIAIVGHHAPLTAAVVLPFLDVRGPRSAGFRTLLVAAAGIAGALLSALLPGFEEGAAVHAATAATAGVLLHVVADEIRAQPFGSGVERVLDFGACLTGLLVAGFASLIHHREQSAAMLEFLRVFAGIALACAPALLLGTILLAAMPGRIGSFRWDAFLVALVLLGPVAGLAWAGLSIVLLLPVGRWAPRTTAPRNVVAGLISVVRQRAPSMLALLMAGAGLEVSTETLPASFLAIAALAIVTTLAARLEEAGGVVVAAALVHKGFDPGIAIALLALGPLTRAAVVRAVGRRPMAVAGLALECAGALALGKLLSVTGRLAGAQSSAQHVLDNVHGSIAEQAAASPLAAAAAVVLLGIALATLWSAGIRGWFAPLRHGPRAV